MPGKARGLWRAALLALAWLAVTAHAQPAADTGLAVDRMSITRLQQEMTAGRLNSETLVRAYLARIAAYDREGPRLHSMLWLNTEAVQQAQVLDRERARSGPRGPLHGIPIVVKDNFATADMPTTAGSLALAGWRPGFDATLVRRLREAGAVILGKSAMHELASGITNVSSLTGATRNPFDPSRSPGGSSGGSAVALAAGFAAGALGSDTCGSIRIPAAQQGLVGLRVTSGLTSRSGMVPLSGTQDVAGPIARSVEDLAILLEATVGEDALDPATRLPDRPRAPAYLAAARSGELRGARIGVLRELFETEPRDEDMAAVYRAAMDQLRAHGAELVDVNLAGLTGLMRGGPMIVHEFKFDLAHFLADHPGAPVQSLQDVLPLGLYHAQVGPSLAQRQATASRDSPVARQALAHQREFRATLLRALDANRLDALAYPTLRMLPARLGDAQAGFACQLASHTGLPAITVPVGQTPDELPAGLELLGRPMSESRLLALAGAWERIAPPIGAAFSTPALALRPRTETLTQESRVGQGTSPGATVRLEWRPLTSELAWSARYEGDAGAQLLALTVARGTNGPVVISLLAPGQQAGSDRLVLRGRDRRAWLAGQLVLRLHTRDAGLAGVSAPLPVPRSAID